jgi:hypothetical protein
MLAGPSRLKVELSSSSKSIHLVVNLYDIHPDGRTFRIADGALRAERPWPRSVVVDLGDLGYRLQSGHVLGLSLAASSFPRYILHPGNETDPWTTSSLHPAELAVSVGGRTNYLMYTVWQENGS